MPVQQRDARKNYIDIVSEKTEEQRADEWLIKSSHRVQDFFLGVMAAVLRRQTGREAE
jgi:hypothetical protein